MARVAGVQNNLNAKSSRDAGVMPEKYWYKSIASAEGKSEKQVKENEKEKLVGRYNFNIKFEQWQIKSYDFRTGMHQEITRGKGVVSKQVQFHK